MAFETKRNGFKDGWFVFDSALVVVMVIETWVMTAALVLFGSSANVFGDASMLKILRLFRLSRMLRMAKLLRAMPELMIMIKGMTVAMRSVFFTLCLLIAIVYVFAVTLTQLCADSIAGDTACSMYFDGVLSSMDTLFLEGTLPDVADFVSDVGDEGIVFRLIMLAYISLAGLVVMNMLVGVLVEAVSVVATVEKEQMLVNWVRIKLQEFYDAMDEDGDGLIHKYEFERLLSEPQAARTLDEVGVDVIGLVDFVDMIFQDDKRLTFSELMDVILSLRGENIATVKDIVDLRKLLLTEISRLSDFVTGNMSAADLQKMHGSVF
jgi:hypothetical protein